MMVIDLLEHTPNPDAVIERACRICYNSPANAQTRQDFIRGIIRRGHESVIEHASATFEITGVSRALSHQLVRHRIASYSQRSQRYVKEGGFDYVFPPSIKADENALHMFMDTMQQLGNVYQTLVELGIPAEDARMVLPNACHTSVIVTMNFRALRHFFELRCDKHAQWEIRKLACGMLETMNEISPAVFGDLYEKFQPNKTKENV